MTLFISVAVTVEGSEGSKHVEVARRDCTINADPADIAADIGLSQQMVERLGTEVIADVHSRLQELSIVLARLLSDG